MSAATKADLDALERRMVIGAIGIAVAIIAAHAGITFALLKLVSGGGV